MDHRRTTRALTMPAVMIFALALTSVLVAACGDSSTSPPASSSPSATVAAASPASTPVLPPRSGTGTIAFIKNDDHLYTIRSDGTGRRLIARDALCAAWSPDGSQIAYGSRQGLFVVSLEDLARRLVVDMEVGMGYGGSGISWSPDGERIAFSAPGGYFSTLQVVNADGSGLKDLTKIMGEGSGYDITPAWSPQGRIYFGRLVGNTGDISSVDPDGSDLEVVTAAQRIPAFSLSPDGKWLLLWDDRSGRCVRMAASGYGMPIVVLETSPWRGGYQASSSWSPDGSRIVFSSDGESGVALYVVRIDGSHLRRIPNTKDGKGPAWRP